MKSLLASAPNSSIGSTGCAGGRSPAQILARLDVALTDFQVGAQSDDTAAVALRPSG